MRQSKRVGTIGVGEHSKQQGGLGRTSAPDERTRTSDGAHAVGRPVGFQTVPTRWPCLLALVSVLAMAACGVDKSADDGADPDEPATLAEYLGIPWLTFNPEEQQTVVVRQQQQVQELIAACMAEEGFEYVPIAPPTSDIFYSNPYDVDFASEYGFGITTMVGEESRSHSFMQDQVNDPNQAILDALPESEQAAYRKALYSHSTQVGVQTDPDTGETEELHDTDSGRGCIEQAQEEVYQSKKLEALYEQLDLVSMYDRIEADPRMLAFADEWSECMNGQGYEYDHPESMYEKAYTEFGARLEALLGSGAFSNPFSHMTEEESEEMLVGKSPEEIQDLYKQAERQALEHVDQDALSALQEEERSLAVASAECSDGILDLVQELSVEYEVQFIEENRVFLEQFKADSED